MNAADALVGLRDTAVAGLEGNPWYEPEFAARFVGNVNRLVGEPRQDRDLDLYPAEATLLVLLPLVHHVHHLQMAARLASIKPGNPRPVAGASSERRKFDEVAEQYTALFERSAITPSAVEDIGWWIFHRWLIRHDDFAHEDTITTLCGQVGEGLEPVLDPARTSRLLHGLRRGPGVCNSDYLSTLEADDPVQLAGNQRIREKRLVLLLTLALGLSVEMTTLPDIVAEHLAVPEPVELSELRETLQGAAWTGHEAPVLRAECHHAAVIEGLKEHAARTDELLRAIQRTALEKITEPMPPLPIRLSAERVGPASGVFTGWASFRLDERRIRDLLMGDVLYKNSDLAVRELYQNALDACRYRRARTQAINQTHHMSVDYPGKIILEQSADSKGRTYLECTDDGIGMDENQIRDVFTKAGARFAEQPDYKQELAAWQRLDPPVDLYPNSRFGIGVLSYFMLADEIHVTTCRMGLDGLPGPEFNAVIYGPGHLFRITRTRDRGERPGTTVRLYLKKGKATPGKSSWSAVDVLDRILGIADFHTTAHHGRRAAEWDPGRLRQKDINGELKYGDTVEWPEAPEGVNITWCASGGAVLVDGITVKPAVRTGVLRSEESDLFGAVVSLSGRYAPKRLSVDREHILDDVSATVGELLEKATSALSGDNSLFNVEWLRSTAANNPLLGDVLVKTAMRDNRKLRCGRKMLDLSGSGFLPADVEISDIRSEWAKIPHPLHVRARYNRDGLRDNVLLWRILTYRPRQEIRKLEQALPELGRIGRVRPALPTDWDITYGSNEALKRFMDVGKSSGLTIRQLFERMQYFGVECVDIQESDDGPASMAALYAFFDLQEEIVRNGQKVTVGDVVNASRKSGLSIDGITDLWRRCGVHVSDSVHATAAEYDNPVLSPLWRYHEGWLHEPFENVSVGHLVRISIDQKLSLPEVCDQLSKVGLTVDLHELPEFPTEATAKILSSRQDGKPPWLNRSKNVPPACVLEMVTRLKIDVGEAIAKMESYGFTTSTIPPDANMKDVDILREGQGDPLNPPGPVPYSHIFARRKLSLDHTVARLTEYGFDIPFRSLGEPGQSVKALFRVDGPFEWDDEFTNSAVPFAKAIFAAVQLNLHPRQIADQITKHGIPMSCNELPRGLSFQRALQLIEPFRWDAYSLNRDYELSLNELLELSQKVRAPMSRVVSWLNELGVPVPDAAETIRKALKGVPLAD